MDAAGLGLTLAGTVLKVIIFSVDFIGDAKEVYRHGSTDRNIDLATVAQSVEDATTSLDKQIAHTFCNNDALSKEEKSLWDLSLRAAEIGRELAQKLRRLTATTKQSKWQSLKTTVLVKWDARNIETIEKRLNSIKEEIQLQILVALRDQVNRSHDEDKSSRLLILEEVAKARTDSKEDTKRMIEKLNNADAIGQGRHEELTQLGHLLLERIDAIPIAVPQVPSEVLDQACYKRAEESVLKSLWYPTMHDREQGIAETYPGTFRWVFEDPEKAEGKWDSFVDFLRKDLSNTYRVTGKAGCGKSTLMKFVGDSPETQTYLKEWAGDRTLVGASFYFYYDGGEHQKSKIGLLRSLLYFILAKRRDLIPSAFRSRLHDSVEGREREGLTLPEGKKALRDLLSQNPNLCFFVTIDGLDEFDPRVSRTRVQTLVDFTLSLREFRNVKLLVSSRPLPEFELGYNGCPSLSVHLLTQENIRRYANEKLTSHPNMEALMKKEPVGSSRLLTSIVDSSLGVFLWVRLVTESLVEGLTNFDDIDDLRQRLDDLPSDLKDLYRALLGRIDSRYKPQSARFLCFLQHVEGERRRNISLLELWFAENADDDMVHNTAIKPISDAEFGEHTQAIKALLKSRCLGLIEAVPQDASSPDWTRLAARFLHRSVHEFLSDADVWNEFVKSHLPRGFRVTVSLLRSHILQVKKSQLSLYPCEYGTGMEYLDQAKRRAFAAELETNEAQEDLIYDLDAAMQILRRGHVEDDQMGPIPDPQSHWSSIFPVYTPASSKIIQRPLHETTHASLMTFAAESSLVHFIRSQVNQRGRQVLDKPGMPLLGYAMTRSWPQSPDTIEYLLSQGFNVNGVYNGVTLWELFLWTDYPSTSTNMAQWPVIEAALLAGADPNLPVVVDLGLIDGPKPFVPRRRSIESWGLPWWPEPLRYKDQTICTLLVALVRQREIVRKRQLKTETAIDTRILERIITFLEDRGAEKKIWTDDESIKEILLEVNQRMKSSKEAIDESIKGESGETGNIYPVTESVTSTSGALDSLQVSS